MSIRVDTASLIAGALVCGNRGLGVLGSDVAGAGDDGDGILFNDVDAGDETKEFRALVETLPSDGDLFVYEDGSFTFANAADGDYTFTYELFVDGVSQGTATASITIGAVAGAGDSAIGDFSSAGAGSPVDAGTGADTVGDFTSAGQGAAGSNPVTGTGADQVGEFASAGAGSPVNVGQGASTVDEFGSDGAGTGPGTPRVPKTFTAPARTNSFRVPARRNTFTVAA